VVLVMVLWLVVLLTIVAASFATQSRVETRMAGNLVERERARALVETGLSRALLELLVRDAQARWPVDGQPLELASDTGVVLVSMRSLAGLVDLNSAPRETLVRLFALVREDAEAREAMADALADWRDTDDLKRLRGAEDADYAAAGRDYGTPDRALESVDELAYVAGFDRGIVEALWPFVTVHSRRAGVDHTLAAPALVAVLGGEVPAAGGSELGSLLEQLGGDAGVLLADGGYGAAPGNGYRIRIEATTTGGARRVAEVDVASSRLRERPWQVLAAHGLD
jgi:general secretion pathway protein K